MKGFIEVTDYDGGMRVILPIEKSRVSFAIVPIRYLSKWVSTAKAFRREYS